MEMALKNNQNYSYKVKSFESHILTSGFFLAKDNTINFYKLSLMLNNIYLYKHIKSKNMNNYYFKKQHFLVARMK